MPDCRPILDVSLERAPPQMLHLKISFSNLFIFQIIQGKCFASSTTNTGAQSTLWPRREGQSNLGSGVRPALIHFLIKHLHIGHSKNIMRNSLGNFHGWDIRTSCWIQKAKSYTWPLSCQSTVMAFPLGALIWSMNLRLWTQEGLWWGWEGAASLWML